MKLSQLTIEQRNALADEAKIDRKVLRHYTKGRVMPSAKRAILLEQAAARLGLVLRREDMAEGCKICEFAKRCRKA